MSPNHLPPAEITETRSERPKEIGHKLEKIYKTTQLQPNTIHTISTNIENGEMKACENTDDGRVEQQLLAVVKAGNEFFNIVNVNTFDRSDDPRSPIIVEGIAVTKRNPDGRAELVDFIDKNEKVYFGRSFQGQQLGETVSGKHFAVGVRDDGLVAIADFGSTNGSRLYEKNPKPSDYQGENPVDNIDFWSVKSSEMKKSLHSWYVGENEY